MEELFYLGYVPISNESNPKEINSHYNVTHAKIKGEIDILVDNKIFEIKTNQGEIATMTNIIQ